MVEVKLRSDAISDGPSSLQGLMEALAIRKQTARNTMNDMGLGSAEREKAAAEFAHCQTELTQLALRQIQAIESNSRPLWDAMESLSQRKTAAAAVLRDTSRSPLERKEAEKEVAFCQWELEQLAERQIEAVDGSKPKSKAESIPSEETQKSKLDWHFRDAMEALALRKQQARVMMNNPDLSEEERKQAAMTFAHCQTELGQLATKQIQAIETNTKPLLDAMEALTARKEAAVLLLQNSALTPIEKSVAEKELAYCQAELEQLAAQQMQSLKLHEAALESPPVRSTGLFPIALTPTVAQYQGLGCIPFTDLSEIIPPPAALFLSSRPPAECEAWLLSAKHIGAILDVTNAHSSTAGSPCASPWGPDIRYLNIPVFDTSETDLKAYFAPAVDFIHRARGEGISVLVHCEQGISRSVSCVLAYLVIHLRRPLLEAYRLVEARRPIACPNPAFCLQLMSLEPVREECLLAVILLERTCSDLKQQGVTAALLTKAIIRHHPDWWTAVSELRQQRQTQGKAAKFSRSRSLLPKMLGTLSHMHTLEKPPK